MYFVRRKRVLMQSKNFENIYIVLCE